MAGDLRGRLMGTASQEDGSVAVRDADVTVTGSTPNGPWKETAKTGKQGDFEVPLPFAANGPIEVSVAKGDLQAKEVFDSRDISTQLTPKSEEIKKNRLSLCGTWEFAADPPKDFPADQSGLKWNPIKVPAHWEMEGFTAESGRAVYRKTFHAPADWQGKRIKLLAEAIYSHAQVWVNGKRVGAHEGGFTPFELDITDMVKPGAENEILVLVDARTMASDLDNASYFAYFELAGIWQPIEVFATSPTYLSHLTVTTDFDKRLSRCEAFRRVGRRQRTGRERRSVHPLAFARSARQGSAAFRSDDSSLARPLGAENLATTARRSSRRNRGTPSSRGSINWWPRSPTPKARRTRSSSPSVSARSRSRAAC